MNPGANESAIRRFEPTVLKLEGIELTEKEALGRVGPKRSRINRIVEEELKRALRTVLFRRIQELRQTRGRIRLLSIPGINKSDSAITIADMSDSSYLIQRGIIASQEFFFDEFIGKKNLDNIFKTGELPPQWLGEMGGQSRKYLKPEEQPYGIMENLRVNDFIILDQEPQDEIDGISPSVIANEYHVDATYVHLTPQQKAKFTEILKVGRIRSGLKGIVRLLMAKELK